MAHTRASHCRYSGIATFFFSKLGRFVIPNVREIRLLIYLAQAGLQHAQE